MSVSVSDALGGIKKAQTRKGKQGAPITTVTLMKADGGIGDGVSESAPGGDESKRLDANENRCYDLTNPQDVDSSVGATNLYTTIQYSSIVRRVSSSRRGLQVGRHS